MAGPLHIQIFGEPEGQPHPFLHHFIGNHAIEDTTDFHALEEELAPTFLHVGNGGDLDPE